MAYARKRVPEYDITTFDSGSGLFHFTDRTFDRIFVFEATDEEESRGGVSKLKWDFGIFSISLESMKHR